MRLVIWLLWCLLGFCCLLAGCRAAITAGQLEASITMDNPAQASPPTIEVHYDQDSGRPAVVESGDTAGN